jgi:hypothetical protein
MILSDKSSGSSLLQRVVTEDPSARFIANTPHHERETLYWNKAVAALGLPQPRMADSRIVPMSQRRGADMLLALLNDNMSSHWVRPVDESLIFAGWTALTRAHGPVFVEKTPHLLHSTSALQLLRRYLDREGAADVRVVGLVRHPVDTLYSMWRRWSVDPAVRQHEWVRAYTNLLHLRDDLRDRVLIIRYEDLVGDPVVISRLSAHVRLSLPVPSYLRADSIHAWHADRRFSFNPSRELSALAEAFGYDDVCRVRTAPGLWAGVRAARQMDKRLRRLHGRARSLSSRMTPVQDHPDD